jgi:hypothetical protein
MVLSFVGLPVVVSGADGVSVSVAVVVFLEESPKYYF